jgi:hypothetical protein
VLGVIDSQMTKTGYIQHCNWAARAFQLKV